MGEMNAWARQGPHVDVLLGKEGAARFREAVVEPDHHRESSKQCLCVATGVRVGVESSESSIVGRLIEEDQTMAENISLNERADALERKMSDELDLLISKSALFNMADGKLGASNMGSDLAAKNGKYQLMDDDPRLPEMPAKPTLLDYFTYRAKGINHLLQSATHALKASMPEKTILACLLHDIANAIFIKSDHGYWGAQLIEPYVDEEVTWAVRAHQALR